jgi:hypothetical protein
MPVEEGVPASCGSLPVKQEPASVRFGLKQDNGILYMSDAGASLRLQSKPCEERSTLDLSDDLQSKPCERRSTLDLIDDLSAQLNTGTDSATESKPPLATAVRVKR